MPVIGSKRADGIGKTTKMPKCDTVGHTVRTKRSLANGGE